MTRFSGDGRAEVTIAEELVSVDDHLDGILALLPEPDPIELRVIDSLGLVAAREVRSRLQLPTLTTSAMDGYAVSSSELTLASELTPVELRIIGEVAAGSRDLPTVSSGHTVRIMTGAPIPPGADAVVPVETARERGDLAVFFRPAEDGSHIRPAGEDVKQGQVLVEAGRRISPADIALMAAAGTTRLSCNPPPRVVVMSTGDELVRADREPPPGHIRDSNGPMLSAMVRSAGGVPFSAGIVGDDLDALCHAFDNNSGHADLFVCTGGASAGTRDLLSDAIARMGEVAAVKVAMRPGMPQIRGRIGDVPVIGLPGNPVSAFVSFEVFVRPAIRRLQGRRDAARPTVSAVAGASLTAPPHKRGYVRVRLERDGAQWRAVPTGAQGSHMISSLARADGLAIVPEDVTAVAEGQPVIVQLLVDL